MSRHKLIISASAPGINSLTNSNLMCSYGTPTKTIVQTPTKSSGLHLSLRNVVSTLKYVLKSDFTDQSKGKLVYSTFFGVYTIIVPFSCGAIPRAIMKIISPNLC